MDNDKDKDDSLSKLERKDGPSDSQGSTTTTTTTEEDSDVFAQPLMIGRRYENPISFTNWKGGPTFKGMLMWKLSKDDSAIPKKEEELAVTLPVRIPSFDAAINSRLSVTWLGHSTCFVRLDGLSFLTDPSWAKHASAYGSWYGPYRYRPPPCPIDALPELNFAITSHDHYDHFDPEAIRQLSARFPAMEWFVPMGLKATLQSSSNHTPDLIHEMNWGECYKLVVGERSAEIWCLPAQHHSGRSFIFADSNQSLWSGWAVVGDKGQKVYYSGDTGFCDEEFARIGRKLGPFDLSLIPIGVYAPRWYMSSQHIDVEEAVQVHKLVKSKRSLGIHFGTYALGSTEFYLEPPTKLKQIAEREGLREGEFFTIGHGDTWALELSA